MFMLWMASNQCEKGGEVEGVRREVKPSVSRENIKKSSALGLKRLEKWSWMKMF